MMYRFIQQGEYCVRNECVVGSPKCDKCPCNFGERVRLESFGYPNKVIFPVWGVKCTRWIGFSLSQYIKDALLKGR